MAAAFASLGGTCRGFMHALPNRHREAFHKPPTDLTPPFETIVIEDLDDCGMSKNHELPGMYWVGDCTGRGASFTTRQRGAARGCRSVFPVVQGMLGVRLPQSRVLGVDVWTCIECGVVHERDRTAQAILRSQAWPGRINAPGPGTSSGMLAHTSKVLLNRAP
jgi:hypothetical protein